MAWCCTEGDRAYVGDEPVITSLGAELAELVGTEVHVALRRRLAGRATPSSDTSVQCRAQGHLTGKEGGRTVPVQHIAGRQTCSPLPAPPPTSPRHPSAPPPHSPPPPP